MTTNDPNIAMTACVDRPSPTAAPAAESPPTTPPPATFRQLYSVGHSTHDVTFFVDALRFLDITSLIDVRTQPRSRANPQFNKDVFSKALLEAGIGYVHMPELGGVAGGRRGGGGPLPAGPPPPRPPPSGEVHDESTKEVGIFANLRGEAGKRALERILGELVLAPSTAPAGDRPSKEPGASDELAPKNRSSPRTEHHAEKSLPHLALRGPPHHLAVMCACWDWRCCHRQVICTRVEQRRPGSVRHVYINPAAASVVVEPCSNRADSSRVDDASTGAVSSCVRDRVEVHPHPPRVKFDPDLLDTQGGRAEDAEVQSVPSSSLPSFGASRRREAPEDGSDGTSPSVAGGAEEVGVVVQLGGKLRAGGGVGEKMLAEMSLEEAVLEAAQAEAVDLQAGGKKKKRWGKKDGA